MVEVNFHYQRHTERTEIDVIRGQKWSVILEILQLAHHNPEIDWRTGEVKITRCPVECGKQQRLKQEKPGWKKQKEKEKREETKEKVEKKEENNRGKEDSRRIGHLG